MPSDPHVSKEAQDPRVYFAAERTLLAWIRTGLAMMGFGFVVARFGLFLREIADVQNLTVPRGSLSLWAGTALVIVGILVNVFAALQHHAFLRRFHRAEPPRFGRFSMAIFLAVVLSLIGVAMAIYLVLMR